MNENIDTKGVDIMDDNLTDLKIHFDSIVVDTHNDTMMKVIDEETFLPKIDIGENTENHIDIPKLKKGGINACFFAAFTDGYYNNLERSISRTLGIINALYFTEKKNSDTFKISSTLEEIKDTVNKGKIAAVPTIEGGYSFDKDNTKELIKQYHDLGVKVIAFTWNYSNELGEGASRIYNDPDETPSREGLTNLGKELVLEMNNLGMVIDVSHMSEKSFWDTIEVTKSPIIASHSGVYSLREHPRNLKDDQLKAIAKNGGTVGMVLSEAFLTYNPPSYMKDFIDQIDYIVDLIGIDYVGLGSDFDGTKIPVDMKDSSEMYKITEELIKRGYKKEDIEKILGKNMLRVLKDVEENAEPTDSKKDKDLNIIPDFNMGEKIKNPKLFTCRVEGLNKVEIDEEKSKIIVDGIVYKGKYNKEDSTFSLKIEEPLRENFHAATFEIVYNEDKCKRETRIFYIND
ncbi:dipeptidase [Tissierella creatinophila]|nr:dipeptidase [Tissierella creatinophila]